MLGASPNKTLVDVLIKSNLLAEDELLRCLSDSKLQQQPLQVYLVQNKVLTSNQIIQALAAQLGREIVDLKRLEIDRSVINHVPVKFASHYKFMPIRIKDGVVVLAVSVPLDVQVIDEIRVHLSLEPDIVLARQEDIDEALKKYYGLASDTIDHILTQEPEKRKIYEQTEDGEIEDIEKQSSDPSVTKLVNQILLEAFQKRATDIHIEPYRSKVRFRYRIDGVLVDANLPPAARHFLHPILSRIKIIANLSITEKRLPQDGSATVKTAQQNLDLRVSTIPTPRGESMVIRILPASTTLLNLEKLGFNKGNAHQFRDLIQRPHGILFVTGPTGSGKTTTLYACLNEINSSERKIITIEDPIEYEMEGVTQIQIKPEIDLTFAKGLRSILRHDPDIIMVGEVRDLETAEIAIRTALTGHLVFSTLHTNDAASGITRLVDMGVESYLVASSVEAFVAQRLVRVICPECKIEDSDAALELRQEIASDLGEKDFSKIKVFKGAGCDHCNGTGFYGRTAIYEILEINEAIKNAILEKPRAEHIKRLAVKSGMKTLRQDGWKNVIAGVTTPMEVMNVTLKEDLFVEALQPDSQEVLMTPTTEAAQVDENKELKKDKKPSARGRPYEFRAYPRVKEALKIQYQLTEPEETPNFLKAIGEEQASLTIDISAGGIKFLTDQQVIVGSIIELKIDLNEDSVECLAKICRVEQDNFSDKQVVGVYYLDISNDDRAKINQFTKEKLSNSTEV